MKRSRSGVLELREGLEFRVAQTQTHTYIHIYIYIYMVPPPSKPTFSYPFLCRDVMFMKFEAGCIYIYIHPIRNIKYLETPIKNLQGQEF